MTAKRSNPEASPEATPKHSMWATCRGDEEKE
jgi:hypothetical protein